MVWYSFVVRVKSRQLSRDLDSRGSRVCFLWVVNEWSPQFYWPSHHSVVDLFSSIMFVCLCFLADGSRICSWEGEKGREEVGRKPIWPWRMEHSDSRNTGLVTQSCIPGVKENWEWGRGGFWVKFLIQKLWIFSWTHYWRSTAYWMLNSVECKCILLL